MPCCTETAELCLIGRYRVFWQPRLRHRTVRLSLGSLELRNRVVPFRQFSRREQMDVFFGWQQPCLSECVGKGRIDTGVEHDLVHPR